ncbi:hypothetical protein KVT40_004823 [Elsinoe batatas]|uniref:Uncharacterized protein n=1 Tax=Elsinoe batatas TaxID=2601811 RepID=A0A8K0L4J0_9PEZI|nr:hypothetical protein KVT40_004823 [Elsinoe batatas]
MSNGDSVRSVPVRASNGSAKPKHIDVLLEDGPLLISDHQDGCLKERARSYQLEPPLRTSPARKSPLGNASIPTSAHRDTQPTNKTSRYQCPTVEDETPSAPTAPEPKKDQQSQAVPDGTIDAVSPLGLRPISQKTPDHYIVKDVREDEPQHERARTTNLARADTGKRRKEPRAPTIRAKQVVPDYRFVLATFDRYSPGPGIGTLPDDFPKPDMSWQLPPKVMDDNEEIDTAQNFDVQTLMRDRPGADGIISGATMSIREEVMHMSIPTRKGDQPSHMIHTTDMKDLGPMSHTSHPRPWIPAKYSSNFSDLAYRMRSARVMSVAGGPEL